MSADYLHYVRLQYHYDNPNQKSDVYDSSGLRIYYTPTLRDNEAGLIEFGIRLGAWQFIPPGMSQAINTAYCMAQCTNATNAIPDDGVYAFNVMLHAHTLGVALELKHIRNGVELAPIAANWAYDFDYQQSLPLSEHVPILAGDEFILDCYYNSENQTDITYGGESTEEEMCQAYVYVYPRPKLGNCLSTFTTYQTAAFYSVASLAGYLTGNDITDYQYDIGGDSYTYSSLTWQNGSDLYNFLWSDVSLESFRTRQVVCDDIDGASLISNTTMEIPYGYTKYETSTTCKDIENAIGQIGDYIVDGTVTETTTTKAITTSMTTTENQADEGDNGWMMRTIQSFIFVMIVIVNVVFM